MSGKNRIYDDKKVKKRDFYKSKKLFKIDTIDSNKVLVPNKALYGPNK